MYADIILAMLANGLRINFRALDIVLSQQYKSEVVGVKIVKWRVPMK